MKKILAKSRISSVLLALILNAAVIALLVCTSSPIPTPTPTSTPTPTPTQAQVTLGLIAIYDLFDLGTNTVLAGAKVTVRFNNEDDTPHYFSVYESSAAQKAIFTGRVMTGPALITYNFTAPEIPGSYFPRSDVYPNTIAGTFKVTSS